MTVAQILAEGWTPPHAEDKVEGLVQVRDYVIIVTTSRLWKAVDDPRFGYQVQLIGHH